jgi:hypothetical protein
MPSDNKSAKSKTSVSTPSATATSGTGSVACTVKCGKCNKSVDEGNSSVECELCLKWHHVECTSLNKTDLKTLEKLGVHWYCGVCEQSSATLDKRIRAVEIKFDNFTKVQDSETRTYADVVNKIDSSVQTNKTLQEQISKQISVLKTEQEQVIKQVSSLKSNLQADNRSKNVVIFGVPESTEKSLVDSVIDLMKDCSMNISIEKSSCFRLGQKTSPKSRPVKLILSSEAEKWEVLRRINSIKPLGIFARKDLSKEEQEADFVLRQELKEIREKDPLNQYKIIRNKITKINN